MALIRSSRRPSWWDGLLLLAPFMPDPAASQTLLRGRAQIDHTTANSSSVVIRYDVDPGTDTIVPLRVVDFSDGGLGQVSATIAADSMIVVWDSTHAPRYSAELSLAIDPAETEPVSIELRYAVAAPPGDGARRHRTPIPTIMWPTHDPGVDAFSAVVIVPASHQVYDAFPSDVRRIRTLHSELHYRFELPVVPALTRYTISPGPHPLFTVTRLLDGFVLVLFTALGIVGFRAFSRSGAA